MERFKRRMRKLRIHHLKSEIKYTKRQVDLARNCLSLHEDSCNKSGFDKDHSPSSGSETELSSHSDSDKDYHPTSPPSSSEDELSPEEPVASSHCITEKEHHPEEAEGQHAKDELIHSGPEATTNKGSKQTEETDTSDGDIILKDGELPLLSSSVKSQKKIVTDRKHVPSDAEDGANANAEDGANAEDWEVKKLTTGRTLEKRWRKTRSKRRHESDGCGDEWGEVKNLATGRTLEKRWKKTSTKTRCEESDGSDEGGFSKIKGRRPWTEQEKTAVQQNMAKFIALRRVPAKNDCLLCIGKASPVLSARTWKDACICTNVRACTPGWSVRNGYKVDRHRVTMTHLAQTDSELSLLQGELVLVHRPRPDGRVLVTQESSGQTGLFHSSVLQALERLS